ncbi:hypothetical protein L3Q82_006762 [Scortum barcoo]|uniref:Uncharacterized protein n=1 Tax=Scortum barcoo TaxID=214431 RepID=A0ACB8WVZ2_9TELE|nr:hypothetical protein L3Q82_006762 [Scortum barcoo]
MDSGAAVSLMVMYEDESVDVRCANGAELQLSPCGCEFMQVKPTEPRGHPLQPPERVRQRTRFTISAYKPFCSIDSDVQWPEWSSCDAEPATGGKTTIKSEEGRAVLMLSPSGEEFSVEFMCSLSQTSNQHHSSQALSRDSGSSPASQQQQQVSNLICQTDETKEVHQGRGSRRNESIRSRSCSPRITSASQPKPEKMYQATTVIQHHSCCAVDPIWCYPLSLARHLWTARLSKPEDARAKGVSDLAQAHWRVNMSDVSIAEKRSRLPRALPLTCPSPHWHRWKIKDPLAKKEHSDLDLPTELVKVLWCQGVTYRILSGAVSVVEVSPGDGSVIRSNGVLSTYFTHHKPDLLSGQVKEVTYHLNNLPPDVPTQPYSVCSIVSRASRILTCYNEAKQSLKLPATPSCLQEGRRSFKLIEENVPNPACVEQHVNITQMVESRSDLVAAELEKIKRFNYALLNIACPVLLENSHLLRSEKGRAEQEGNSAAEATGEVVNETCIAEALQRTSKAIQDIDALISAATLT